MNMFVCAAFGRLLNHIFAVTHRIHTHSRRSLRYNFSFSLLLHHSTSDNENAKRVLHFLSLPFAILLLLLLFILFSAWHLCLMCTHFYHFHYINFLLLPFISIPPCVYIRTQQMEKKEAGRKRNTIILSFCI